MDGVNNLSGECFPQGRPGDGVSSSQKELFTLAAAGGRDKQFTEEAVYLQGDWVASKKHSPRELLIPGAGGAG